MRKYEIMQEFLDVNFSGCFIVDGKVVNEDYVRELVDKAIGTAFDWIEDELIVCLDNESVAVSYM